MKVKTVFCIMLAVFVVFCFCNLLPSLVVVKQRQQPVYRGVIDLWHVETFEGGSGNRGKWLTTAVRQLESKHKGLYVQVTTYTYQQMLDKLSNGDTFDVISFASGVGNALLPYIVPIGVATQSLLDNFVEAGQINNVQYALPYSVGFYALFTRQSHLNKLGVQSPVDTLHLQLSVKIGKNSVKLKPLGCGFGTFNNPLQALDGVAVVDGEFTQYQAYEKFVGGKSFVTLLGTQRDVYRLSNRVDQGKIEQISCCVAGVYNDLAQYLAVSRFAQEKTEFCKQLIALITSDLVQQSLVNIQMLSPTDLNLYADGWMSLGEQSLDQYVVPNAFKDSVSG